MITKKKTFNNKRVYFDYSIQEKIEAGIVLLGTEVKSIRENKISINGSFCVFIKHELYLRSSDIAIYDEGSYNNHDPKRDRKLLLSKKELRRLKAKVDEKGLTIVPIRLYSNEKNMFKIEIGVAKGRKYHDKRDYIKDRETKREMRELRDY